MSNFAFFICSSLAFGNRTLRQRGNIRTVQNDQLRCQAYRCKDEAEFIEMQELVGKANNKLWCAVKVEDSEGNLHPLSVLGEVIPTARDLADYVQPPSIGEVPLPVKPEKETSEPKSFTPLILEAVKERKHTLAELSAKLNLPTAELKVLIKESPELKIRQGGWVTLAEAE